MLEVEALRKRYGKREVLKGVSFSIPEGTTFGLLGPNGAGKTSLIRILMGLLGHDGGQVRLFGGLAPGDSKARARIGYMPQEMALYPNLTIWENLMFFGRLYGMGNQALRDSGEEVLKLVELTGHRNQLVARLSGGMARRVMLASVLIHRPPLLILDEPTVGVDPLLRVAFWDWFARLEAQGVSLLITTHHISEAARCRQVVFLRQGELIEQGPPQAIMEKYGVDDLEEAFVQATRREESLQWQGQEVNRREGKAERREGKSSRRLERHDRRGTP